MTGNIEFFDSHSHYNDERFDNDRDSLIKKTFDDSVTKFMCIGYDINSSIMAVEISKKYDFIYSTVGISPNDISENVFEEIDLLSDLSSINKVKAIGEIGLADYWNTDNKDIQIEVFKRQIKLANEKNLPICIHTRDAYKDTISVLKENPVNNKGIFHCVPLNQELIKDALKLDFYISFSGVITFKNANAYECVSMVPMNKILIETDSPYLSPEPHRGERNDSRNVKFVAKKIAEIKGESLECVANATYQNTLKVYKI